MHHDSRSFRFPPRKIVIAAAEQRRGQSQQRAPLCLFETFIITGAYIRSNRLDLFPSGRFSAVG